MYEIPYCVRNDNSFFMGMEGEAAIRRNRMRESENFFRIAASPSLSIYYSVIPSASEGSYGPFTISLNFDQLVYHISAE